MFQLNMRTRRRKMVSVIMRKDHLQNHVIAKHTNPEDVKWFQFEQCSFRTKQKKYLKIHVDNKHTAL
ncbi:hypothetical protein BDFB_013287 [Asbolus verrucosus]|uniref:Uncharacterized protein n=1 Tax=Asbolus verrucosus TaxID=1661398 RepID=A0A482VAZ7_ASBVE|nr:hypothetical protein BDFB_013287 [Asbolus verrucosus]